MNDQRALAGVRVVDCSTRLSGAFCARLFGDCGADVVLLELPSGHPLRGEAPFLQDKPGPDRSLVHAYANLNKRSACLDEADERRARLLTQADVVVVSTRAMADAVARITGERTVIVAVSPYGLSTSMADVPGTDLTAYAVTGWALANGHEGEPPLQGVHRQPSYVAGVMAYLGAVAALHERDASSLGQTVDVSELEPLAWMAAPSILAASHGDPKTRRRPSVFGGPVAVRDGYISATFSRPHFWTAAMQTLGLHELADDPRYKTSLSRRAHTEALAPVIEARMKTHNRWDLFNELAYRPSTIGVVLDMADLAENEQLRARDVIAPVEVDGTVVETLHAPCRMSATPWRLRQRAPRNGEHTEDVLANWAASSTKPPATSETSTAQNGPLAGIRILTFTHAWAGTSATELLGFLGADVIQVESRSHPDAWRGGYVGPIPPGIYDPEKTQRRWNMSASYNSVNLNKRAISLDVEDPRGLDLFRRLIPFADVVADNFTPRVLKKWGLDYEALQAIKPAIIHASLSAYGATGKYAVLPGIGGTLEPMSGLSSLLGHEGGPPQNSGSMIPDPIAGLWFAAAIVTAIRHRDATGEGQSIDLGMMEANATIVGDVFLEYTANQRVRPRMGNHHPSIAPHNIYAARDGGWIAHSATSQAEWIVLTRVVADPVLADDTRFGTPALRKEHERDLDARLAAWACRQDAVEAETALCGAGVPAARLRRADEILQHPALVERGFGVRVEYPEAGPHLVAGAPWQMSRTQPRVTRHSPMMGEHSFEVLSTFLNVTQEEYDALVAANVSGDGPRR